MAIDTIKSTAVLDGAIATADIADDAVTSAKLDTNIDIAGTLDVTGAATLDSTLTSQGDISISAPSGNPKVSIKTAGAGNNPFVEYRAGNNTVFDNMGVFSASDDYWRVGHGGSGSVTTELMAVKADGNVLIHNGNLQVAAGHGISFAADANNADMTSELLDDYEEGTFTPFMRINNGVQGITYGPRHGVYIKVGNLVNCMVNLNITSKGTNVGEVSIDGLPFTAGDQLNLTSFNGTCSFSYFNSLASSVSSLGGWVDDGTTEMRLRHVDGSGNTNTQTTNNTKITNNSDFRFYITYFAV